MLSSSYSSNGLEVSISLDFESDSLVATVITDHYRRVDELSDKERDHIRHAAQVMWSERNVGSSPFENFARVYHGMIL